MKGMATALKNSNSKNYKAITMDLTIPSPSALFAAITRNGKKKKKKKWETCVPFLPPKRHAYMQ